MSPQENILRWYDLAGVHFHIFAERKFAVCKTERTGCSLGQDTRHELVNFIAHLNAPDTKEI